MDDDAVVKFVAFDAKVTPQVSSNHVSSSDLPVVAGVERLVLESMPTERFSTHNALEFEVVEPLPEGGKRYEFSIGSDHGI